MAGNERSDASDEPDLDGSGVRLAIVCGRFNDRITLRLLEGARRGAAGAGVPDGSVVEEWVPGAFEIPFAARAIARSGRVDAVVCLGAVIRGIQDVQLEVGVPVVFGVLTTEDVAQAEARSAGPGGHNVGEECARTAVEMVALVSRWQP
jgi:6,7-dimethyl-8-ribityllumazine synthase